MSSLFDGRYEIGDAIGVGGAARVHRARDARLDRTVALKLLDDDLARDTDPAAHDRFVRESHTAARVLHPNLVTVFDAGEADGRLYLAMELVPGGTLARRIADDAPLPIDEAVEIAIQVLDGLGAVHDAGIVHRDIKPGNILLGPGDRVRLTDFGIARELDHIGHQLTGDGLVMGTPLFISPEQAMGRDTTTATDVYAVGLVLDEMLTARRCHGSRHDPSEAAIAASRARAFDPRDRRPGVPDALAVIVMRATDPDPGHRFGSAADFGAALRECRGDVVEDATTALHTTPAPPTLAIDSVPDGAVRRSRPIAPAVIMAGALAAVLVVVATVVAFGGTGVETAEGAPDDVATLGVPGTETATFEGTTLDGRVVALRPTPAVAFDEGVPDAIVEMTAASRVGCDDVIVERDRWAGLVGDGRYGDAASVFAQHAQNLAMINGCDPGPVPLD